MLPSNPHLNLNLDILKKKKNLNLDVFKYRDKAQTFNQNFVLLISKRGEKSAFDTLNFHKQI